ncbi:cell division protein [Aurantimonas sp. 22II-16-19i]|nr:cell division protein [Aurantimonas sp. 22II-16-19i]
MVAVSAAAVIVAGSFAFLTDTHAGSGPAARSAALPAEALAQAAGDAPVKLAALDGRAAAHSPQGDRRFRIAASSSVTSLGDNPGDLSARIAGNGFLDAAPAAAGGFDLAGHELAQRGGRVFHPAEPRAGDNRTAGNTASSRTGIRHEAAGRAMVAAALPDHGIDADLLVASLTSRRPELARDILRSIPKSLEAKVAAEAPTGSSSAVGTRPPSTGALARLAAFDPQPSLRPGLSGMAVAAYQSPGDFSRPSFRPQIDAAIGTEITAEAGVEAGEPADASVLSSVPLPASRPETEAAGKEVQVASLEPEGLPGPLGTVTEEMTALVVPLPERRPNYQPPVVASPQPEPARQQPAQRRAPQPAPAVASTRPNVPGQDSDRGGSFFERLFSRGSSAKLPPAHLGVAVYDISAQTVYLPGDGKLEAHSGLGHMQDNPRYVAQKMRGPTPPNVYNLRMREALFHGVEAIRLLPADGRKKYNRDGLLAHSYMYVGGGDRSQSNGCIVFKNYDRFLAAFKRGKIKKMIVVKSLDELPTYMAAL